VSYSPGPVPRLPDSIPPYLYGELLKIRAALSSTEGGAQYLGGRSVSTNYTANDSDRFILVDTTSGSLTVTLPAADDGRVMSVKKLVAANTLTIATPNSETIDGAASKAITSQYENVVMQALDGNWHIQ